MIVKTDYQRSGAGDLIQYIKRNNDKQVPVRDTRGRELDSEQLDAFVKESREHSFERHMILAPDPLAEYSTHELSRNTRMAMREWTTMRSAANWVYAVHSEHRNPHSHVAVTGPESQLRMNQKNLERFRETARETFREQERVPEREAEAQKQRAEREPDFLNREIDPEPEREPEPEAERTRDWGGR